MMRRILIASACAGIAFMTPAVAQADSPAPNSPGTADSSAQSRPNDLVEDLLNSILRRVVNSTGTFNQQVSVSK